MPLSPYEQQLLAAIEKDLTDRDPRLARTMTRNAPRSSELRRFPLRRRHLAALAAALLTLILVHALAGQIHPAASAALTCGLLVPWLVGAARAVARAAAASGGGGVTPPARSRAESRQARQRRKEG